MTGFEESIQKWVSIDNQIKLLNEKMKELRDKRSELSDSISSYVDDNNLQNATVQISDGRLRFANTRVQEPLTFKYLEKSLGEVIKNEVQVKQILEYLKKNRESKMVPEIKRLSNA
jgi:uncharacterized coiled-coil DUF342 family protein